MCTVSGSIVSYRMTMQRTIGCGPTHRRKKVDQHNVIDGITNDIITNAHPSWDCPRQQQSCFSDARTTSTAVSGSSNTNE